MLLLLGGLALLAGCHSTDRIETELRDRECELRQLREEMQRLEGYNQALQRELHDQRTSLSSHSPLPPPETSSLIYTLKTVMLARQTGGYDSDGIAGDESLQVVLEPKDVDGHTVKAPGTLTVTALEVSEQGLKKPIDTWQVTAEDLRRAWRSGLFSTGYFLLLPWKVYPGTEKMRIVAQFTLADGRLFEADRDVTVRLVAPDLRKSNPPETPEPPTETAPPPRKSDLPMGDTPSLDGATSTSYRPTTGSRGLSNAVQMLRPVPLRR
jgi:hypothetical protein